MGPLRTGDKELTNAKDGLSRAHRIEKTLKGAFAPRTLEVIDESARHAGHAGASPEGETHFKVRMKAAAFNGLSRLSRQRAVLDLMKDEFACGLHALSLELTSDTERDEG